MNDNRFDRIVKSFAAPRTRRTVFKTIGAAVASSFALDRANSANAASSRGPGTICRKPADCDSGICGQPDFTGRRRCSCPSGYQVCGDNCVDPAVAFKSDAANCGSCGKRCSGGKICCNGTCVPAESSCGAGCCTAPQVCYQSACCLPNDRAVTCAGKCGPQADNCGRPVTCDPCCVSAGQSCATNLGCCSGTCLNGTCAAGPSQFGGPCDETADCQTGVCCNSTCVDPAAFQTDLANCGTCGNACPAAAPECGIASCAAGVCGGTFAPNGWATSSQTAGDCHENVCNGAGQVISRVDDDDRPTTTNPCLAGTCSNGVPAVTPVSAGESCTDNGGTICDGAGNCVFCAPGSTDACYTGPDGTENVGICRAGTKTCNAQGTGYGACIGEVTPGVEITCNGLDDDCDDAVDNGVCPPVQHGTSGCFDNACAILSCDAGYADCNGAVDDGCEADLMSDVANCGECGEACNPSTECTIVVCLDGACTDQFVAAGTPLATQIAGDCLKAVCDGAGGESVVADDDPPADDGAGCTTTVCEEGNPVTSIRPLDAACSTDGGTVCDGLGACVECTNDSQCDFEVCLPDHTCCVVLPLDEFCGSQCGQVDGPCQSEYCGDCCAEAGQSCGDNLDCCSHICVDNVCAEGPVQNGDPCDDDDDCGFGACCGDVCVDISAFDEDVTNCGSCGNVCNGPVTDCERPVCVEGGCSTSYADYGMLLSTQTSGDCQSDICDGAGGFTTMSDDFDTPEDDGDGCMEPVCEAGSPTTRPRSPGAACDEDGGSYCDGNGVCAECITGFSCPSEVCLPDNTCCVVLSIEEFCAGQCGTVVGECQIEECPCGCVDGYETGSDGVTCVPTEATCNATLDAVSTSSFDADFRECNFAGYEFGPKYFVRANFSGANLAGANFNRTNLSGSVFNGANLTSTAWALAVCPDDYPIPINSGEKCCGHLNGSVPSACS